MAKKSKKVKISFELDRNDFESIYEELFEMVESEFCDEYGDDDGEEDYIEPQDRARDYFEGYPPVSYTHLRAHETVLDLVCRLLLEKKKVPPLPHCSPL